MTSQSFAADDYGFMARALMLAERGLYSTHPNPRVGCVLVSEGQIVGEGWHERAGEPHAEVNALQQAADLAKGATVYVTLEPCCHTGRTPPCSQALIDANVANVIVAMQDPNPQVAGTGVQQLQAAGIDVDVGLMQSQAETLNPGFIQRMRHGRPFVRSKLAMSLDGRTAMASGESQWISSEQSRADVQRLRARSCAILTGRGTILNDDPSLIVRDSVLLESRRRQPLRVVVDSGLAISAEQKLFGLEGDILVVYAGGDRAQAEELNAAGAQCVQVDRNQQGRADLNALMQLLAEREVNEVMVEAGAGLNGALLEAGLIDELIVYVAPHLMGSGARGLFDLPGLSEMKDRISVDITDLRQVGPDIRITASVHNKSGVP